MQITIEGQETDNAVLQIVDQDGYQQKSADTVGAGIDKIHWIILGRGTHYIRVSQTARTLNTFDLKVEVRNSPLTNDDFGGGVWTEGTVAVGGSTNGTIRETADAEDNDWFKLGDVTTGLYDFNVKPRGASPADSLLVIVRDQHGKFLEIGASGKLTYLFSASGNKYQAGTPQILHLDVRGGNGDYTVSVNRRYYAEQDGTDLPTDSTTAGWVKVGHDPYPGKSGKYSSRNSDGFLVDLVAGKSYRIDLKGSENTDFGGTLSNPYLTLEYATDESPFITNTDDIEPLNVEINSSFGIVDDNSGAGNNSRLDIKVNTTGTYKIVAGAFIATSNGTYTVVVNELHYPERGHRETVSETSSDFPASSSTTGYIQVNGDGATGEIGQTNDSDGFAVHLKAGSTYQIDAWGSNADENGGTLAGPVIHLHDAQGIRITNTNDVEQVNAAVAASQANNGIFNIGGGSGDNARIRVNVHTTGTYHVLIWDDGFNATGTYTIYVKEGVVGNQTTPRGSKQTVSEGSQDLPNFITSNGYVQVNGNGATGDINTANDQDVFAVRLKAKTAYEIEVLGQDATEDGGSLTDPQVHLLNPSFDPLTNAHYVEQTNKSFATQIQYGISDADSGSGQNSLASIAVHQAGTYYIQVGSEGT